ncbi:hypothetical protein ACFFGH_32285 [Lysobacter korlensis]|uniref:Uncharacterized protein n=1 Tax=Lysobacter korlensis TaxID=553636 RepID=A0ABV6RZX1_9GAMM
MIEVLALAIVVAAGLFFVTLGGVSLVRPQHASRFLLGFAGSPAKHYAELAVRFLVGAAFVLTAPRALAPSAFNLFGWALLATTTALLLVPWHWHHRFAQRAVPEALRLLPVVGLSSVVLGGLVLWAVFSGNAA